MNIKLLFIIIDESYEKRVIDCLSKFKLQYNIATTCYGTATESVLKYFGLTETKKKLYLSIIPDIMQEDIFNTLKNKTEIDNPGVGIAYTVPIKCGNKFITDTLEVTNKDGEIMEKENYYLVLSIVKEGFADNVMDAAKKSGAQGGTVIHGKGLDSKSSIKFLNLKIEPEKDIVLIVATEENRQAIMESITTSTGIKTSSHGMCIALPVDGLVGFW